MNTTEEAINYAYEAYKEQYARQGICLQVYKNETCVYSSLPETLVLDYLAAPKEKNMTTLGVIKQEGRRYEQIQKLVNKIESLEPKVLVSNDSGNRMLAVYK